MRVVHLNAPADLEIGDTAGLETCDTGWSVDGEFTALDASCAPLHSNADALRRVGQSGDCIARTPLTGATLYAPQ